MWSLASLFSLLLSLFLSSSLSLSRGGGFQQGLPSSHTVGRQIYIIAIVNSLRLVCINYLFWWRVHPQVTHRETLADIMEATKAAVTVRGQFFEKGKKIPEDQQRLFLLIEANKEEHVRKAKMLIRRIIEEATEKVLKRD